ncbi:MAG: hypothetical protein HY657_03885 [Acidobacteria bacterium]|nr:hypothetical protein [Acidobacteriota bacterium]
MVLGAWRDGWRRVLAAPAVVAGVFAATLLAALPLALTMRGLIDAHLGGSLMAEQAVDGVSWDWWQEFTSQASGLGATLTPSVVGFAATLDNVSSLLDGQREIVPVAGALALYLLVWIFLSGAILDRYARQRPTRAHGFFAAAGAYFWRFLRLGVLAGAAYWFLFTYVHEWLFTDVYTRMTRDLAVERQAFAWRVGLYVAFGLALAAVNVVVDYAKVRTVVEDRRSAIGSLLAALAFVGRNPGPAAGLYALNALVFLGLIGAWAVAAPGAGGAGMAIWLGFALSQLYVLARLALKLQFLASQTALFQASLAHATYTAAPEPVWPESPAAETIRSG